MKLGKTGIETPQNAFGALPIQRVSDDEAVRILRKALTQPGRIPTVSISSVWLLKA